MTLKEKFELIVGDKIYNYIYSVKCVKIADEFAIGFIKWYASNEGMDLIHDLQIIGEIGKDVSPEEILEIYKKEKGL
jgi:hypothetical protein